MERKKEGERGGRGGGAEKGREGGEGVGRVDGEWWQGSLVLHPVRPSYSTPGRPVALLEGRGEREMNDDLGGYERLRWMERSTKSGGPRSRSRA